MAKRRKKSSRRRRHVRGGRCGVERVKGHRRMVCRNRKGQITKSHKVGRKSKHRKAHRKTRRSSSFHCPARHAGHKVFKKRLRKGGTRCAIKLKTGALRFVKRVRRHR